VVASNEVEVPYQTAQMVELLYHMILADQRPSVVLYRIIKQCTSELPLRSSGNGFHEQLLIVSGAETIGRGRYVVLTMEK